MLMGRPSPLVYQSNGPGRPTHQQSYIGRGVATAEPAQRTIAEPPTYQQSYIGDTDGEDEWQAARRPVQARSGREAGPSTARQDRREAAEVDR